MLHWVFPRFMHNGSKYLIYGVFDDNWTDSILGEEQFKMSYLKCYTVFVET